VKDSKRSHKVMGKQLIRNRYGVGDKTAKEFRQKLKEMGHGN